MPTQILTTKLSIPPLRNRLVTRARLFHRLNQGLECGFVLVSAPAGYGKTTLLSAWISEVGYPTAWLSLDEGDNDPICFLTYLAAALRQIGLLAGEAFDASLQSSPLPAVENLLTPWLNHLVQVDHPFCLVLDDYHAIQNQEIQQIVSFLLEHRPAPLHLAIATRADPPLPLSRLRARSQLLELRLADLRFSSQEAGEFLTQVMGLDLGERDLASLQASTEGWIAGLQMAGLSLHGREDPSGFIQSFSGENRFVLDFLFDEVFQRQPSEIQDFLLQTSILERFSAPLCNAVTLGEDGRDILTTLERNNLFLIALDEQRKWYRYHHLFGDLLKGRLQQTLSDSIALLHQRASAWYAAEHDLENAIAHALAASDFEVAADLIEQIIPSLDLLNQQTLLTFWVDSLPREILKTRPWLCIQRAWGDYSTVSRGKEEEWLQAAEQYIQRVYAEDHPERLRIQGYIAMMRAYLAYNCEDIPRVLEMGQKALQLLPDSDDVWGGMGVAMGCAYWALGDVLQSEQAFRLSREASLKISNTRAVHSTSLIGGQQLKQGRLQDAMATFQDALRLATRPNGSQTPIAGFPNIRIGDLWRERNDLARAGQHLDRGVEQCAQLCNPDFITDAYICLGRTLVAAGNLEGAREALRKADRMAQQTRLDPYLLCWLEDCRLKAWLADGDLESASLWAGNSGLAWDGPLSYLHDLHHQNLARVLVAQGLLAGSRSAHEQASSLLSRLLSAAGQAGWVHEEIKILVLQAVNDRAFGKSETAMQSLAQALTLAEPGGYVRIFLDEGENVRNLLVGLAIAFQKGQPFAQNQLGINFNGEQLAPLDRYIAMLIAAFDKLPSQARQKYTPAPLAGEPRTPPIGHAIQNERLVEPLSGRELEVLALLAQGCSDKEIAEILVIARETVHKHLKNIYGKLDVHSRTAAVARARQLGMV